MGLETLMFGFGQLSECLGGIIFTFVAFSPGRHFHLFSGISLSLSLFLPLSFPVPVSLLSFASVPLCLFVPPIASANLPLKPIPGLFQKCSTKHEFYMPCTQSSVNTFTDHCGCTHPITDIHISSLAWTHTTQHGPVFTSSGAGMQRKHLPFSVWMNTWACALWTQMKCIRSKKLWLPDVLLIINHFWSCEYLLKIFISGRNESGGFGGEQQWVWQRRWSS